MNTKYSLHLLLTVLASTLAAPAAAQIPRVISFQGVLLDESGNRRPDGTYVLTFALYDSDSGSGVLWTETQSAVVMAIGARRVDRQADGAEPFHGT